MYVTISMDDIELDFWEVYGDLSQDQQEEVYRTLRTYYEPVEPFDLNEPEQRLSVIVALREMGYTVEPR